MEKEKPRKKCFIWHIPGEWQKIDNPHQYLTAEMYRAGMIPTHIRSCPCGEVQELKIEEHP